VSRGVAGDDADVVGGGAGGVDDEDELVNCVDDVADAGAELDVVFGVVTAVDDVVVVVVVVVVAALDGAMDVVVIVATDV